jgi:large subunit ribosomal protein L1
MAKTKAELLEEAKGLGIEVDAKLKVAEVQALINNHEMTAETVDSETEVSEPADTELAEAPEVAKAGKRSAKALKEAEEQEAKEARKAGTETEEAKPKQPVKQTRSRLERRAKGYRKSAEQIEQDKAYTLEQAIELAKKTSHVKFDATVELHVKLGVDPRQADQNIRDNFVLPAGTGKNVKVAVFTDDAAAAKQAGADIAGTEELIALFDKGTTDFDILIATPNLMPQLGKYARTLGPRGLMPNPKSGTVTTDINKAVAEAKAGRVEYRVDSTGIVHLGVGKVSFTPVQLLDNVQAALTSLRNNKPQSLKGNYVQKIYLTTSMGPSIAIDTAVL